MIEIIETFELVRYILINFICEIFYAVIDVILFTNLFNVKISNKVKMKIVIVDGIFRTLFLLFIPIPFNRILNLIVGIILFNIFCKAKIEKSILGEVINAMTTIITETLLAKLICVLMPGIDNYMAGMNNYIYASTLKICVSISRAFICFIVYKKKIFINISDNLSTKNRNNIIIVSVLVYMVICFNELEMIRYIRDFPYSIFVIDIVSIIVCFCISMRAIVEIGTLEEQDIKIQNLESYNKTLSIMYDSIRGFRHDFCNFVQALDGYVKVEDMQGIRKMSQAIVKECKEVNNMEILDPNIIKNPPVYSIVTNKYYLAQKSNITMNIEIMTDLENVNDFDYEFCRILAILIDNAIEAAKQTDEKIVNLRFIKNFKSNRRVVIVENTYDKSVDIDMDKLFDKGYTNKTDTKNQHGLGLWTVKRILDKNERLDLFTTKGETFIQELEIYDLKES